MGARAFAAQWVKAGLSVRIISVDEVEEGVDDFDTTLLRRLEKTPITGKVVAVFYHVPNTTWLELNLPPGSLRVMLTTFDGVLQGDKPPPNWLQICNAMDLVFLNEFEISGWNAAGLRTGLARPLVIPHIWLDNSYIPQPVFGGTKKSVRFLTIAMFQPRRRWDTLLAAFLQEFADDADAELYIKVNYPAWHPVRGQPQADLAALVSDAQARYPSRARIIIDESAGTRREICALIDSSSCYVSTDTAPTAPIAESIVRGKKVIVPRSVAEMYPAECKILIEEDVHHKKAIDDHILLYQPHHKGGMMPLLHVSDVRRALRAAYQDHVVQAGASWVGWDKFITDLRSETDRWTRFFVSEINQVIAAREADGRINLCWEGSQFVYHSLAHVNRQLCLRLGAEKDIKLRILPYEQDQFDPRAELPAAIPLIDHVYRPLQQVDVHLRHQWPPNFTPPAEGAWVMIQPWEFGGIPQEWLVPMRDLVDEIWVPTHWVRDCYIKSGIPGEKVQVVPNGVDPDVFSPHGPKLRLKTDKTFRFLFLGGTIARKGIDVVLDAYLQAFSAEDDVCLVIKGQPGSVYQGSELDTLVQSIQNNRPDAPEIEYTNVALTEDEMGAIYRACDVLVHPYRGEGFGLPIAEAMSSGLPVIITRNGAARDFTDESFAYLISSERKPTRVDSFSPTAPGFWLEEPNVAEVAAAMRASFLDRADVQRRGILARDYAVKNVSWDKAAALAAKRIEVLSKIQPVRFRPKKVGFVYRTDWSSGDWMEILISYISEFKPGEPVSLIFPIGSVNKANGVDSAQAIELVASVLGQTGQQAFPDIVVTDQLDEWLNLQESHELKMVSNASGSTVGLDGVMGQRLGKARLLFVAARS